MRLEHADWVRFWREQRASLPWALLMLWLAAGVRLTLTTGASSVGLLDDAVFVGGFVALVQLFELWPRGVRVALVLWWGLLAILAVLADAIHYKYFGTFVNADDIFLTEEVGALGTSVKSLITPGVLIAGVGVPLVLLGWSVRTTWHLRRRRLSPLLLTWPVLAWAASLGHATLAHGQSGPAYNNPVALVLREVSEAVFGGKGVAELVEEISAGAPAFVAWPGNAYREHTRPDFPLLRVPVAPTRHATTPRNVVLILMESVRAYETGLAYEGPIQVTPNLKQLAQSAIEAPNFYAVGHQTVRGEGAVLCSMLSDVGGAPTYVRHPEVRTPCLPEILQDQGYSTYWISGFRSTYFNKKEFLTRHGVAHIDDMSQVPRRMLKTPIVGWGPSDVDIFSHAIDVLRHERKPFFAEIMTLSNHHPFSHNYGIAQPDAARDVHQDPMYRDYLRGIHYTDYAIGKFFEMAAHEPWFDNTLFIITGDHGAHAYPRGVDRQSTPARMNEMFFRVPFLMLLPERKHQRLDAVTSQVDIAPTVLDLLGVRASNAFMGVSMLAQLAPEQRVAFFATTNEWSVRQGDDYCYPIGTDCVVGGVPRCAPGQHANASGHACFSARGDLLDPATEFPGRTQTVPDSVSRNMLDRGDRLARASRFLVSDNRLFPLLP